MQFTLTQNELNYIHRTWSCVRNRIIFAHRFCALWVKLWLFLSALAKFKYEYQYCAANECISRRASYSIRYSMCLICLAKDAIAKVHPHCKEHPTRLPPITTSLNPHPEFIFKCNLSLGNFIKSMEKIIATMINYHCYWETRAYSCILTCRILCIRIYIGEFLWISIPTTNLVSVYTRLLNLAQHSQISLIS